MSVEWKAGKIAKSIKSGGSARFAHLLHKVMRFISFDWNPLLFLVFHWKTPLHDFIVLAGSCILSCALRMGTTNTLYNRFRWVIGPLFYKRFSQEDKRDALTYLQEFPVERGIARLKKRFAEINPYSVLQMLGISLKKASGGYPNISF